MGDRIGKSLFSGYWDVFIMLVFFFFEDVMVMVGYFLNNFNIVLFFFDVDVLLKYIGECYGSLFWNCDFVVWVVINVVFVLFYYYVLGCIGFDDFVFDWINNVMWCIINV